MKRARAVNNFFDELMVVLVLYEMEIGESHAVISLTMALKSIQQTTSIFVYDNSQNAHTHTPCQNWQITCQHDGGLLGIDIVFIFLYKFIDILYKLLKDSSILTTNTNGALR